jgi:hypothetical protein
MKVTPIAFPAIPEYLDAPVTFVCRVNGPMLLATWCGEAWLYRVHGDHWCSLRKATADDLRAITSAPRMSQAGVA